MRSFPILARDTELHDKSDARPAVLAYRRDALLNPTSDPYLAPRSVADVGGLDEIPLPAVVLQLPDLKSSTYLRRGGRIPLATHAYWAALILGALFALWLVFSGDKPAELPTEEAPAWTGQVTPPADRAISSWGANTGEPAAAPQWRASDSDANAPETPPADQYNAPTYIPAKSGETAPGAAETSAPALPEIGKAPPTSDGALAPSQPSEAIRTARGGETRWDGSSNQSQPSEAAPLGITIPVPQ